MIVVAIAESLAGLVLASLTLVDVFASILVPGRSESHLRVAGRVRIATLPLWRHLSRTRAGGRRQRLSNSFAPLLFLAAFTAWMGLLWLGFGLMIHASSAWFTPALESLSDALYVSGSSLLTLGVSEVDAKGPARWLILWAALSGFGVITATITFILQIQSNLHQRESGVLTLSGLAGKPPSGIALLEAFAHLGIRSELRGFFKDWRDWSAAVLQSHVSYPVLVYFHSVDAESDWVSALHSVLDAATIMMELSDEDERGSAALMHRAGARTVAHICDLFDLLPATSPPTDKVEVEEVVRRLQAAGYRCRELDAGLIARFTKVRADYACLLGPLCRHLGAEQIPLLPTRTPLPGR
jgi:hypothetical protein